ncbi:uncharacterized protein BHQ10_007666 [Talaromyces amestolkiae]|uniref:Zn(2)-C6 fungal-type domain-containing protein n=1 Tax=Talaromyces amestolkiae TaxID=1196081 RepID=A0A364L769_TALAM|nr:uncharacterized protein BHQ10_007666 [Talaromyces amestolkiae]RAO71654.1 hypothetical protein BHQ10_007666 [Talaromyces amestolkiae]
MARPSRGPQQKACNGCAKSKRRCDQKRPQCQRCLDKDATCTYPQPERRRGNVSPPPLGHIEELPAIQNYAETNALERSFTVEDWDTLGAADLDLDLSDLIIPYTPAVPAQEVGIDNDSVSNTTGPWFLQEETWTMRHCNSEPDCVLVKMERFIEAVDEMLRFWINNDYNSFIHQRLYENGMPSCVQDAFTTLATYIGRAPAVKETILQIVEDRLFDLTRKSTTPVTCDAQGILAHLARVQALFVYEFIGLFDGSVRLRTSAEKHLPTLRQWVLQMWEVVRLYRGEDFSLGLRPLQWTATDFDREYNDSSELWQLWILTESVRRTHIIIDSVANAYETMTRGLVDCAGAVMFTARNGLWEADSAVKWFKLCCEKPPLLVPSLQPGPLISQYPAEELDDFAKFYWTYLVGTDKIQSWIDKSYNTN